MRFNNKGQAKKNGDTDYVHQPGPPSFDIPGFMVAMNAGGNAPVFEDLYESVISGREAERVITEGSKPDYREKLETELNEIKSSELWRAGAAVRSLRPKSE